MYHGVFVQVELAEALGVPFENYNEADSDAALIGMPHAQKALAILTDLVQREEQSDGRSILFTPEGLNKSRLLPRIVSSNVAGIGTLLSYHISDDNFIDVFTDGSVKTTDLYMAIMENNATSRFSWSSTFIEIKRTSESMGSVPQEARPADPIMPAVEEEHIIKCSKNFTSVFGGSAIKTNKVGELEVLRTNDASLFISEKLACKFAESIGKSVFFMQNGGHEQYIKRLNKELFKDFVFVFVSQSDNGIFTSIPSSGFRDQVCLGYYVDMAYAPIFNAGEKESPLAKFDEVMTDRKTGVIFCLRKQNIVSISVGVKLSNTVKEDFYDRLLKEVARRWGNNISDEELELIDEEYNKKLSENDKEDYIRFAVASSNTYVKKIKTALTEGIKEIGELQRQLAEKMKVYNQYVDIIENYDEKKHEKELEAKSIQAYSDVLCLPQVRSMFIKEGKVNVFTNPIIAIDERTKKKHVLGSFHIRLNMMLDTYDTAESVYIKNLTSPLVGGYSGVQEAPHIFNGGHMCHGNLTNTVIECYANRDIYGLISAIVFFLEAANTADYAGQHINKWPEYKEEEKKKTKVKDETDDELSAALTTTIRG